MFSDKDNLCLYWLCTAAEEPAIKRSCARGVRVPTWWNNGTLNMCTINNTAVNGGEPVCLRASYLTDIRLDDSKQTFNSLLYLLVASSLLYFFYCYCCLYVYK